MGSAKSLYYIPQIVVWIQDNSHSQRKAFQKIIESILFKLIWCNHKISIYGQQFINLNDQEDVKFKSCSDQITQKMNSIIHPKLIISIQPMFKWEPPNPDQYFQTHLSKLIKRIQISPYTHLLIHPLTNNFFLRNQLPAQLHQFHFQALLKTPF